MNVTQSQDIVILSEAGSAQSALPAKSNDPSHLRASIQLATEFSPRLFRSTHAQTAPCHPEAGALCPLKDLSEPREASRSLRRNIRAFGSLPYWNAGALIILAFALATLASAQTLTGTVKNATTGKPAAGDEVVLLTLGQGMQESGRTTADAKGNFSFKLDTAQAPHLVRAIHQEVTYHTMAPPGAASVNVEVYDVGKKIEGIQVVADIMRVQVEQGQLEIMRAFAVENKSQPPRTQMNERNLEFNVPEGAEMIEGSAMTANGNPLNTMPVPVDDKKTRYSFFFPLRPGTTQFQVAYQLPYTGSANIDPKSVYPLEHFVAILPKSIQFSSAPGTDFRSMNDPQQPDAAVQVASSTKLGQSLAFKISGEGILQAHNENGGPPSDNGSAQQQPESRPGGGLGPPIDAPPPLQKYQWWILGGFTLALVTGGVFVASRQQATNRQLRTQSPKSFRLEESDLDGEDLAATPETETNSTPTFSTQRSSIQPSSTSSKLLEGLKEELFQLEVERQQGRISQEEYEKSKAALDYTLQRALKREAVKQD